MSGRDTYESLPDVDNTHETCNLDINTGPTDGAEALASQQPCVSTDPAEGIGGREARRF